MPGPKRSAHVLALGAALVVAGMACTPDGETCAQTDVVVGVVAESSLLARARTLDVTAYDASGEIAHSSRSSSASAALFPFEVPVRPHAGQSLRVRTELFDAQNTLVVSREVSAPNVSCSAPKQLLRVYLEAACVGVLCSASQTCAAGRCVSAERGSDAFEPYASTWAEAPDPCAPSGSGEPQLTVGLGQTDYGAVPDGADVKLEAGPQGGHHVWIAVRTKNLRQRAATLTLNAKVQGSNAEAPTSRTVFSLRTDEGGFCKLYGIRYQLDGGKEPLSSFLGKTLVIRALVQDESGKAAEDTLTLKTADTL